MVVVEEREGQPTSGRLWSPKRTSFMSSNQMCKIERKCIEKCVVGFGKGHNHNNRGEEEKTRYLR